MLGPSVDLYVMREIWNYLWFEWNGPTVLGLRWEPQWFLWTVVATRTFVIVTGLVRILLLRGDRRLVAWALRGRPVSRDTCDEAELRLLDVVDEMAIASGIPAPEVFVLDREAGINAFTAGRSFDSAVVAVTHGALEFLDRDELQGVVAHEFSLILNGEETCAETCGS